MPIPITRNGSTVTARDSNGKILRVTEFRSVAMAVAIETRLAADEKFASWWASEVEPVSPEIYPERFIKNQAEDAPPKKSAKAKALKAVPKAVNVNINDKPNAMDVQPQHKSHVPTFIDYDMAVSENKADVEPLVNDCLVAGRPVDGIQAESKGQGTFALDHPWYFLASCCFIGHSAIDMARQYTKLTTMSSVNLAVGNMDLLINSICGRSSEKE